MITRLAMVGLLGAAMSQPGSAAEPHKSSEIEALIAHHAKANGVPEALVHRVVKSESRYNPKAVGRGGTMGLMQIKHGTARALGYSGTPSGLLAPDTNLTYGVRYLAGAYKVANGNADRAVSYFRSGYYHHAKRKGLASAYAKASPERKEGTPTADVEQTASTESATIIDALKDLFSGPSTR